MSGKVEWRAIDGFSGYVIHALGTVRMIRTGYRIKVYPHKKGLRYKLRLNNKQCWVSMESLIVRTFPEYAEF